MSNTRQEDSQMIIATPFNDRLDYLAQCADFLSYAAKDFKDVLRQKKCEKDIQCAFDFLNQRASEVVMSMEICGIVADKEYMDVARKQYADELRNK